jgi:biogenesis AIM24-like protein
MNCPNCGAPAQAGGFCGRCGAHVEGAPPAQPGTINLDMDGEGAGRGYSYHIEHQPAFSLAVLALQPEQSIMAEAGAMVSMSANIELQSQMKGGLLGALSPLSSRHSPRAAARAK